MLQQTRVAAVVDRYRKFLHRFPSVTQLAAARESAVLAEWSGLGYYRRARNLQAAAQQIAHARRGVFPATAAEWRELPGIGRYTAAAIASIAFNRAEAVLDGNVERVLRRLLGGRRQRRDLWRHAQEYLDHDRPGDFNQAMMELGAMVCTPAQPRCSACPIRRFCRTRGNGETPKGKVRRQKREVTYCLLQRKASVLLVQRQNSYKLMPGMWELPEANGPSASQKPMFSLRHSITVTDFRVQVVNGAGAFAGGKWVRTSRLPGLPLTGLTKKILRRAGIIQ